MENRFLFISEQIRFILFLAFLIVNNKLVSCVMLKYQICALSVFRRDLLQILGNA